jgi:hypothetical protein
VLQEWLEAPGGPASLWNEQLAQFRQDIIGLLRRRLGDNESTKQLRDAKLDIFSIDDLDLSLRQAKRTTREDIVQRTAAVLGVGVPVAAAATWVGSALAASVVFPPAAVIAGAAAAVYLGVKIFRQKVTSLGVMQQEWIAELDSIADGIKAQFEVSLGSQCTAMIDYSIDSLGKYRDQLEDSMDRLQVRMADPGYQMRQEIVDQLSPLSREGESITAVLSELAALV